MYSIYMFMAYMLRLKLCCECGYESVVLGSDIMDRKSNRINSSRSGEQR